VRTILDDQISFLDGHVRAFAHLDGVPARVAYDNLRAAVVRIPGRWRADAHPALAAHYLLDRATSVLVFRGWSARVASDIASGPVPSRPVRSCSMSGQRERRSSSDIVGICHSG